MSEFSVRYVRVSEVSGEKPVLGFRGKKKAVVVISDDTGIHTEEVSLPYFDKSPLTTFQGQPYPIPRFLEIMADAAKRKHMTSKADHLLQLAGLGNADAIDEDLLHSMPEDAVPADDPETVWPDPTEEPSGPLLVGTGRNTQRAKVDPRTPRGKSATPPPSVAAPKPKAPRKAPPAAAPGAPKRGRGRPPGGGGGVVARVAADLKVDPAHLRKACRAAGMKAPYPDDAEKIIRAAWKKHGKT